MTEGQVPISAHLVGATIDVFSTGVWGKEFVWWFHTCMFFLTQWHLPSVLLALVREGCVCIFIFVKSIHAAGVFTSDTGTPPHTHTGAAEVTKSSSPGDGENKAGKVHKTVRK